MRRILLTLAAAALAMSLSAQTPKRITWTFSAKRTTNYVESGEYAASKGEGTIEFVGKRASTVTGVKKSFPAVEGTRKGDYWLMTIPVENIKAGTAFDLWFPFLAEPSDAPHPFAFEYLDGKEWKSVIPADKDGINCYSTTSSRWPRYLWQTIRLEKGIKKGCLKVRLRQCSKDVAKLSLYGGGSGNAPKVVTYDDRIPSDTTRVLFIGNSYTYYNLYPMQLKEIAWNEGHYLECATYLHGGYTMKQHLSDHVSRETIEQGGFDYAFLQDQSLHSLRIGTSVDQDVVGWMGKMKAKVEKHSPKAKCFIELTWGRKDGNNTIKGKKLADLVSGYPEFFTSYKAMQDVITANTTAMAQQLNVGLSPVGVAWEIVRRERPEINLYIKDGSHPSVAGSYLSAAVGYLTLFKEPFKADTPVTLNADVARYLRSVAERVVLNGEK